MSKLVQLIPIVLLSTLPIHNTTGLVTRGNVVFNKVSEVTVSRSYWKVTFILDLSVYDGIFDESFAYINKAASTTWDVITHHENYKDVDFNHHYTAVHEQIKHLNETRSRYVKMFENYKTLSSRGKRSLIPFLGEGLSWLFGVSTDADLDDIRSAVNELGNNQEEIRHVVEKSLTLINNTHREVIKNRDRIIAINKGIGEVVKNIKDMNNMTMTELNKIRRFLSFYNQLDDLAEITKEMLYEGMEYFSNLRTQIDMLSIGKLTPSVVPPARLRNILREIHRKLPPNLYMPVNPNSDVWSFYSLISCAAVFEASSIIIVLKVPLASYNERMDIYQAYNLPLPFSAIYPSGSTVVKRSTHMVAQYELETNVFAIDKARSRYIMLNEEEAKSCLSAKQGLCDFSSPIFPINVSKFCLIALFTQNKVKAKELCKTKVKPNAILPMVAHVDQGLWLVSTQSPITFSVICDQKIGSISGTKKRTKIIHVKPPLDAVNLDPHCVANSDFVILPPYYKLKSVVHIRPNISDFFTSKNFSLWQPLFDALPTFNYSWNLKPLEKVKELEMSELIDKIQSINKVHIAEKTEWSAKQIITTVVVIVLMVIVGVMCTIFFCKGNCMSRILKARSESNSVDNNTDNVKLSELTNTSSDIAVTDESITRTTQMIEMTSDVNPQFKLYPQLKQ